MDVTLISQLAGAAPLVPTKPPTPVAPDDLVVERFNQVMKAAEPAAPADGVVKPVVPDAQAVPDGNKRRNLGDAILSGLEHLSTDTQNSWASVQQRMPVDGAQFTAQNLMDLQASMMKFTFMYEVVGKGISKTAQDIDALVKMQ